MQWWCVLLFFLSFPYMRSLLKVSSYLGFCLFQVRINTKTSCFSTTGFEKMLQGHLSRLNVSRQVSQTPMTETGRIKKVSESQEANWDEMPGWFWGTKRPGWKGWKNPRSFHPSEPREQRRQNWYLLACCTLPFCLEVCVSLCVCV